MARTLAQRSSYQLFLWGILLIVFAVVSDAVLDAVLFEEKSFREQLFSPTYHEVAIRILFCTFILAAIYIGMHYLSKSAQKEGSLQQRNKDLGLVRQDLEESHEDASAQLRNTASELATSIELLNIQCGSTFDEKTRFFMDGVNRLSKKLEKQLDINLECSELALGEPHREQVKIDKLAYEVLDELKSKQPGLEVVFKIQPWMSGWCDRKMLRFVIYNLFRNAIDSIPKSRHGQVEFGTFNRNGQQVLFVRDNGSGFSEAQAKRLFDPFWDRTQTPDLPKNTLLLAKAKRIVRRHGGQIWAEGIQDTGGTIYFTFYEG